MFDFDWLCTKLDVFDSTALIVDYDLLLEDEVSEEPRLVQEAIQLSTQFLTEDKILLAGQLLGRLLSYKDEAPSIKKLLEQAKQREKPWLRPLA